MSSMITSPQLSRVNERARALPSIGRLHR
jgi:hypothetical protein